MTERNVINSFTVMVFSGMIEFLYPLKWFALLALIIILVDLRFGVLAAKKRGENVRFSRAIKRTGNKMVDYTCWLLLSWALGLAFKEFIESDFIPHIVLAVIFGIEIESCFSNYFEIKGKRLKINIIDFLTKKTNIIEIEDNKNEKEN